MPLIHSAEDRGPRPRSDYLNETTRPDWCDVTSGGLARIPGGGTFDPHFHDCNEYWLVFSGKAKVMSEGQTYYLRRGDMLCTRAGDEHDILEVYEDLEFYWFEDATPEGGRVGHLHKDEASKSGHPILSLPVPDDFPSD